LAQNKVLKTQKIGKRTFGRFFSPDLTLFSKKIKLFKNIRFRPGVVVYLMDGSEPNGISLDEQKLK